MKKNKYTLLFINIIFATILINKNVYAEHIHDENCYNGYIHKHDASCYGEGTDYRECGGTLEWKQIDTITGKCPYCDIVGYSYDIYEATCQSCSTTYKHYTEREKLENPIHFCENNPEGVNFDYPLPENPRDYPKRTRNYDTTMKDFSGIGTSCGKEEGHYYEDEKESTPLCGQIAVSVQANKESQVTDDVDLSIIVTFLDGHTEVLEPTSTTYVEGEAYNGTEIQLIYFGKTSTKESGTLITTTKITNTAGIDLANGENKEEDKQVIVEDDMTNEKEEKKDLEISKNYPIKTTIITMIVLFILFIVGKIYTRK